MARLENWADKKKKKDIVGIFFQSTNCYKHCLKLHFCELKSAFFSLKLENYIFLYFIIQVPIPCLPLSHQKLFFVEHKKN